MTELIFDYPEPRNRRRHGPQGYVRHNSYRPWLRDEYTFRCVYCLKREQWGQVTGEYDVDHFQPQSRHPQLAVSYVNLVYACRRCNSVKLDQDVADPFNAMTAARIMTLPDGIVKGIDDIAQRLILQMDLNSPRLIEWRIVWMRIVDLARERDSELLRRLIGFPVDLPDLRRLRPPAGNVRPMGVSESWASLASDGELPRYY